MHPSLRITAARASAPTPVTSPFGPVGYVNSGSEPIQLAYDSGRGEIYVSDENVSNVSVLSATTHALVATIPVGSYPFGLAYDPRMGEVFVANQASANVSVINDTSHTVSATISLFTGAVPIGVAYDPNTREVWVSTFNGVIAQYADSNNTEVSYVTLPPSVGPAAMAYDSGRHEVFVTLLNVSYVVAFPDTNLANYTAIIVGTRPIALAYDSAKGWVYVANQGSNYISVINDTTDVPFSNQIGYVGQPSGLAYDRGDGYIFATSQNTSLTTVIADATNTQVASIPNYLGSVSWGVAWDPARQTGYVADSGLGIVEVFGRVFPVTFTATDLPAGTPFEVWINGSSSEYGAQATEWYTSASTFAATTPNGSYDFTVIPPKMFVPHPGAGPLTISGAGVAQTIAFAEEFNVTFTETGLPSGTSWSVTLNGSVGHSTTDTVVFPATNGSYDYTLGGISNYEGSPTSGSVLVTGAAVGRSIAFAQVYPLWFNETGLPSGSSWTVTLVGTGSSSGTLTNTSTAASIEFLVSPGYHGDFTISRPSGFMAQPETGTVSTLATGAPATSTISFTPDLKVDSFSATPSTVTVGAQLTLRVTVSGGLAPLTYAYVQLPAGCQSQNASSLVCAPTATGLSIVIVSVSDKLGRTAEANVSVQVNAASASTTVLGLPSSEGYGLIAGLAIAVVAIATILALMMRRRKPPPASAPSPAAVPAPPPPPPPGPSGPPGSG